MTLPERRPIWTRSRLARKSSWRVAWAWSWRFLAWSVAVFAVPLGVSGAPQVDALLLVDTSASMLETDPGNYRLEAVRLFVSLLDPGDRVALVGFDSKAVVFSDFLEASEANKQQLFELIDRQAVPQGSFTNLREPLAAALELSARRRQGIAPLVVLLTDGRMDTGVPEQDRRLIDESRGPLLARMVEQGLRLYGLAFSNQSDIDFLQSLARPSGGFAWTVTDPRDLGLAFSEIFQAVKQPDRLPVVNGRFEVDAGVEELRMVSRSSAGTAVTLRSPSGVRLAGGEGGSEGLIRVTRPEQGVWTLEGGGDDAGVFIATGVSVEVTLPPVVSEGEPAATAEAWLSRDGNRLDVAAAGGSLTAEARLHSLASASGGERLELSPESLPEGGFRLRLPALNAGAYELDLVIVGNGFRRAKSVAVNVRKANPAPAPVALKAAPTDTAEGASDDAGGDALTFDQAELSEALSVLLWGNLLVLLTAILVFVVVQMRGHDS
ncbi:MAG: VWA domain-containing protein [Methylococcaceae bacterium]|nr:VWA domain-containing protein [Methylococcaceae bacterium]